MALPKPPTLSGIAALLLLVATSASAAPFLIKDINPGTGCSGRVGSDPSGGIRLGDSVVFRACGRANDAQLWKTDGTPEGTVQVSHIDTGGEQGPLLDRSITVDGRLFFVAEDANAGEELWVTDGTPEGTARVTTFVDDPDFDSFVEMDGHVFFSAWASDQLGWQLFRSDGTAPGTIQLTDFPYQVAPDSFRTWALTKHNSGFFFAICGEVTGCELWRSDGTAAGTERMARVIPPGDVDDGSFVGELTPAGSALFLSACQSGEECDLWRTDGTQAGTMLVVHFDPSPPWEDDVGGWRHPHLIAVGGTVFFEHCDPDPSTHCELWRSDGTPAGTIPAPDVNLSVLTRTGEVRYFLRRDPARRNHQLWRSDGTEDGTFPLTDLPPGTSVSNLVAEIDGTFLLSISDGQHGALGAELFGLPLCGGEPGPCDPVTGECAIPPSDCDDGDACTADACDPGVGCTHTVTGECPPASTLPGDGITVSAPYLVKDIETETTTGSYPSHMTAIGDTLFFFTRARWPDPPVLWKTDGTTAGTVRVADAGVDARTLPYVDVGRVRNPIAFRDMLAFGTVPPSELWTSDGTNAGTRPITPLEFWETGIDPSSIVVHGDRLFVVGRGPDETWGLWRSDGTSGGTTLVKALTGGTGLISTFRGMLIFLSGQAVWTSDGTSEGTRQIITAGTESEFLQPDELRIVGDLALFTSCYYARPCQLWRTDGTDEGTFAIATLIERYDDENDSDSFNPTILPSATESGPFLVCAQGELWTSDGTIDGTRHLGSSPCNGNMASRHMAELGGARIFGSGGVLWRSDGTPEGTAPLADIQPEPTDVQVLGHTGAVALFAVSTADGATELWRTDGTPAGTVAVSPMPIVGVFHYDDSSVSERPIVTTVGETIFFSGCTPDLGCELWAVTISGPDTTTTTSTSSSTSTSATTSTTEPLSTTSTTSEVPDLTTSTTTTSTVLPIPTTSTTTTPASTTSTTLTCSPDTTALCDDGDPCTVDLCDAGYCRHELRPGLSGVRCRLRNAPSFACGDGIPHRLQRRLEWARMFVKRAADAGDQRTFRRRIRRATRQLEAAEDLLARGAQQGMESPCTSALERAIREARAGIYDWLATDRGN
jgi:ELWxxDGT repeat protein